MSEQIFPTKGSLINVKKSLAQAELGYELMDRKRNILIREMVSLLDKAKEIRDSIEQAYKTAYDALQLSNITLGTAEDLGETIPIEDRVSITYRSIMGVELPTVKLNSHEPLRVKYGFLQSNSHFDNSYIYFNQVKELTVTLAEVENSIFRLATAIKKTQKRANALKNILIPRFQGLTHSITDVLEEKDREEFFRQKLIKKTKVKKIYKQPNTNFYKEVL